MTIHPPRFEGTTAHRAVALSPEIRHRVERVALRLASKAYGGRWIASEPPPLDEALLKSTKSKALSA
jgi:hypothetical protein